MNMPYNYNQPLMMHVDLNSCFAIIEQQANPLLRSKPVAVAAYDSPGGMILASSYEAKALGIKLGVSVREARLICKDIIVLMPDPDKYFDAQKRFKKVLLKYTDEVYTKSVDEFVINFNGSIAHQKGLNLEDVGYTIKQDIKKAIGEYVTVNIGVGPNRFLAKLGAGLNKPDGLKVITGHNLRETLTKLELVDLPGINTRYAARLNYNGIHTPLQFLDAPLDTLKKQVFKGIVGYYWYLRLRGHEIDSVDFDRKSFGQQYALGQKTTDREEVARLLMKLCEKTGRRLRRHGYNAHGIHLWLTFEDKTYFSKSSKTAGVIYSTQDIYSHARKILDSVPIHAKVTKIAVTVSNLSGDCPVQLGLFDDSRLDTRALAIASDKVNDKYGEFTMVPATMANMQDIILKRVSFGRVD
jgi:DNA polymerase-4